MMRPSLRELAAGVWAWLQPDGSWGEANAGLVSDGGTSLLVDTLWDPRLTARMLDEMRPTLRAAPISIAVNTHRDGDHWWGNVMLPAQTRILATEAAAQEMRTEPSPQSLARLSALARLGCRLPGGVGRLSRYTRSMLDPFDFGGVATRLPAETFHDQATVEVGARSVQAMLVGPAHTAGDAVVHVPDAGVVFCGDILFVAVTPAIWHGPVSHWITALDRCLALDAETYVPGHGPLGTREDVWALRAYFAWLVESGREQYDAGRGPAPAASHMIRLPEFARWRDWRCPERLALNLVAYFRELDGLPPLETTARNRMNVFHRVANLHHELRSGSVES